METGKQGRISWQIRTFFNELAEELPTILKRRNPDWVNTTEQQRLPGESNNHNNNNKEKKLGPVGLGPQHRPNSDSKREKTLGG